MNFIKLLAIYDGVGALKTNAPLDLGKSKKFLLELFARNDFSYFTTACTDCSPWIAFISSHNFPEELNHGWRVSMPSEIHFDGSRSKVWSCRILSLELSIFSMKGGTFVPTFVFTDFGNINSLWLIMISRKYSWIIQNNWLWSNSKVWDHLEVFKSLKFCFQTPCPEHLQGVWWAVSMDLILLLWATVIWVASLKLGAKAALMSNDIVWEIVKIYHLDRWRRATTRTNGSRRIREWRYGVMDGS